MISYMNINKLLHPNHHAYRPGHSTTTALLQMHDTWLQAVDSGHLMGVCMLDMSAAFDLVDHALLQEKMALYGFDEDSLKWVHSYLSGRSQCVIIDGCLSKQLGVDVGVPQGSILGPLFYTIFTNELPEVVQQEILNQGEVFQKYNLHHEENGSICCYADDATYSC